jgi:cysteine desulfurase
MGVYLDAATAAPLHPVARQALLAALEDGWADSGKLYSQARRARLLLDAARASTAELIGVREDELFFAASGTAAIGRAVAGVVAARRHVGTGIVHSAVEHSAVLKAAAAFGTPAEAPVDRDGRLDVEAFASRVLAPAVVLAAVQSANHEVGTRQPIAPVAEACAAAGVPLLVDAAQTVSHEPAPPGWSLLTASARKWGGPAGVGLLAVRKGTRWEPGDDPGPLDLPAVVAAAAALRAVRAEAKADAERLSAFVDRIRAEVAATVPDVEVVGHPTDRVPHVVTFSCLYVDGEALLHALDREGFAVSSGSACTSDTLRPSHVLAAMGVLTHGNVRVSLHPGVSDNDIERFLTVLPRTVARLRAEAGVDTL